MHIRVYFTQMTMHFEELPLNQDKNLKVEFMLRLPISIFSKVSFTLRSHSQYTNILYKNQSILFTKHIMFVSFWVT